MVSADVTDGAKAAVCAWRVCQPRVSLRRPGIEPHPRAVLPRWRASPVVIDPPRIPAKVAGGFQRSEQSPSPGLRRSRRRASSRHHCEMQMHLRSYWPRHRVAIEASPTAALPEVSLVLTHANVGLHPGCHTRGSWGARRPYFYEVKPF
jgi:hypothetical protein